MAIVVKNSKKEFFYILTVRYNGDEVATLYGTLEVDPGTSELDTFKQVVHIASDRLCDGNQKQIAVEYWHISPHGKLF